MNQTKKLINILKALLPERIIDSSCIYYKSCGPVTCIQCIIYLTEKNKKLKRHK